MQLRKKVIGNWHLKSLTVSAELQDIAGNDLVLFKQKNIDEGKALVITFKEDKSYELSVFGKFISGTYTVDGNNVKITPSSNNKIDNPGVERVYKIQGGRLVDESNKVQAELEKYDVSAADNNKQVRRDLSLAVVDLTFYFAGIEGVSSDQVVSKLEALQDQLEVLSDTEKNEVLKELEAQYHDKFVSAYNKLDDKQKEKVSKLNQLLKLSESK